MQFLIVEIRDRWGKASDGQLCRISGALDPMQEFFAIAPVTRLPGRELRQGIPEVVLPFEPGDERMDVDRALATAPVPRLLHCLGTAVQQTLVVDSHLSLQRIHALWVVAVWGGVWKDLSYEANEARLPTQQTQIRVVGQQPPSLKVDKTALGGVHGLF
ncbi:hypothetical protein ACFYMI_34120 [Streptomyces collinus]|uniref:hypothetical protein n=1 Tax=Streptomyces collinus TaxID=42684 RepID=UPI0036AABB8F